MSDIPVVRSYSRTARNNPKGRRGYLRWLTAGCAVLVMTALAGASAANAAGPATFLSSSFVSIPVGWQQTVTVAVRNDSGGLGPEGRTISTSSTTKVMT